MKWVEFSFNNGVKDSGSFINAKCVSLHPYLPRIYEFFVFSRVV